MPRFAARWFVFIVVLFTLLFNTGFTSVVFAQTATPIPPTVTPTPTKASGIPLAEGPAVSNWVESPVVTEVGKGAERAREFLWWVFYHPPIYSHPVLASMWSIVMQISLALVIITIIMFAIGFFIAQRRGIPFTVNVSSILFKLIVIVLFVVFSYILLLVLLQISEGIMQFFINQVGGKDLFNIVFAGPNAEKNYTDFIGYWDTNRNNIEMRNTSMFLIRLTSMTYYAMGIMLIVRHIILWFLLILSPVLALLMPFILIRNTGWIWIGVFFQWFFYGPLFSIFLAALTKIWIAGIPYGFDFERVKRMTASPPAEGTVYPTAINILYGGPAQILKFNNSANYVDTFAEYIISLVMLWVVLLLPWLLLRIFRDYCCELLAQNQATLVQILDRIRSLGGVPTSPLGPAPTGTTGRTMDLPFRQAIDTSQKAFLSKLSDIKMSQTNQITQELNLSITSMQDIAEYDINQARQSQAKQNLEAIRNPASVAEADLRNQFSNIRSELSSRASRGDMLAQRVLNASEGHRTDTILGTRSMLGVQPVATPDVARKVGLPEQKVREVLQSVPTMNIPSAQTVAQISQQSGISTSQVAQIVSVARMGGPAVQVAQKTGISESKVKEVLGMLPAAPMTPANISAIAQKTGVRADQVAQIVSAAKPPSAKVGAGAPPVSIEDYEEVKSMWVNHYRDSDVPVSEKIKDRAQWVDEDTKKIENVLNLLTSMNPKMKQAGLDEVGGILPFLMLGGFSDVETIMYLKAKIAAAKQVKAEMSLSEKAKAEVTTEAGEDEFVAIEKKQETTQKAKEEQMELKQELPKSTTTESGVSKQDEAFDEKELGHKLVEHAAPATIEGAKEKLLSSIPSIQLAKTDEIAHVLSLTISRLSDIATYQLDQTLSQTASLNIRFLTNPSVVTDNILRERFDTLRTELGVRAVRGDELAKKILAATNKPAALFLKTLPVGMRIPPLSTEEAAKQAGVFENSVKDVLKLLPKVPAPTTQTIADAAKKVDLPDDKVSQILSLARSEGLKMGFVPISATLDDYEDVRSMFKRYYSFGNAAEGRPADAPAMAGKQKADWLQKEIVETTNTVNLLGSTNETDRMTGMKRIDKALPFFFLGGYSSLEAMMYLKAKSAAAKDVLNGLSAPLSSIPNIQHASTEEISHALSLKVSRLSDIATCQLDHAVNQTANTHIRFLTNPSVVTDNILRERFDTLRTELGVRAVRGDELAKKILAATNKPAALFLKTLPVGMRIPPLSTDEAAKQIGGVTPTQVKDVLKILPRVAFATPQAISDTAKQVGIPEDKVKQALSLSRSEGLKMGFVPLNATLDDYEDVREMFERYYSFGNAAEGRPADAPAMAGEAKADWLNKEIVETTNTVDLLGSKNEADREEGMKRIDEALPFFFLGGYSSLEAMMYLKAKIAAATDVLNDLSSPQSVKADDREEVLIDNAKKASDDGSSGAAKELPIE